MDTLKQLQGGRAGGLLDRLIAAFLAEGPTSIAAMRHALAEGNRVALAAASHLLRGSCLNLGVPRMAEICQSLENDLSAGSIERAGEHVEGLAREFDSVCRELRPGSA